MINVQYESSEGSADETTPRSNFNDPNSFNKELNNTHSLSNKYTRPSKSSNEIVEEEQKQPPLQTSSSAENSFVSCSTIRPNVIQNETSSCYASATDEDPSKSQRISLESEKNKQIGGPRQQTEDRFFKPKPRLPSEAALLGKRTPSGIKSTLLQPTKSVINPNSPFQPPRQQMLINTIRPSQSFGALKEKSASGLKDLDNLQIESDEEEQMSFSASGPGEIKTTNKGKLQRESSSNNTSVNNVSVSGSTANQHPAELEEIVKMFTHDLQQSIRQRFKSKAQTGSLKSTGGSNIKRLPFEIQQMMGQANNLYAFQKFEEAIEIFQQIITKMPDHAESYSTISSIYEEMNELEKSLNFGVMAAFLIKTEVERWQKCAEIAKFLGKYPIAIYCLNRAIKQSSVQTDQDQIINMKFTKIAIYKLQKDFSSAIRTLTKMINKFKTVDSSKVYHLNMSLAQTYFEQGQPLKSFEVLDEMVELSISETAELMEVILLYGQISQQSKLHSQFLDQLKRQSISAAIAKAKSQQELKVSVFQIEVRQLLCQIDSGFLKKLDQSQLFSADVKLIHQLKLIEQLVPYQKVVSSLILLAAKIESDLKQIPLALELYELLLSISLQIDQPFLLFKTGILYQKLGNIEKAKEQLEQAFLKCPIPQNGEIRIELSTVYNQLGLNKKAMQILKNPFPQNQLDTFNNSNADSKQGKSIPQKRKRPQRKTKDDEDIIMSSEEEENDAEETKQGIEFANNESAHLFDMSDSWNFFKPHQKQSMQPPSIVGSGLVANSMSSHIHRRISSKKNVKGIKDFRPNIDLMSESDADADLNKNFKSGKELKFQRLKNPDGEEREFMLKRNRKLQKRIHAKKEQEEKRLKLERMEQMESSQAISKMKLDLIGFNAESFVMIIEQCKLCLKIGDQDGLIAALDGKLDAILDNLKIKQDLQDTLYRMNLKDDSPQKEHFFMKKFSASDLDQDPQAKVCQQAKIKIIEEINMYPNIFSQVSTEDFLDVLLCYLAQLLKYDRFQHVADYLEAVKKIELLMQLLTQYPQMSNQPKTITQQFLNQQDSRQKIFYEIATIAYLLSNQHIKAYKALRQISTPQELMNWAVMGCIINKNEDSSFCRSYFKRIFRTKQVLNPFILMILGNNYLQKQQLDLAIRHFYLPYKSFYNKNQLLNLTLAISYLCQSYQRTNTDKEKTIKTALTLLLRYAESREDRVEVQYNFARALHFMGMNANARELYESILQLDKLKLSAHQQEIRVQAVFNLSQLLKGAGISSGITVVEGANLERMKYNDQLKAHQLIMNNIVI